jgi:HSP20 family protein
MKMTELAGFQPNAILDVGRSRPQISVAPESWIPTADAYAVDDVLVIEMELSGCEDQTITTKVVKDETTMQDEQVFFVTVEGQRDPTAHATERFHNERWQGKFARIFRVPTTYDDDQVDARYNDGLLRITIAQKPNYSFQVTNIFEQLPKRSP